MSKKIALIGAALGWGAQRIETEEGPEVLQSANLSQALVKHGLNAAWQTTVYPSLIAKDMPELTYKERVPLIQETVSQIAEEIHDAMDSRYFPVVLGGDHSVALGTWSGIATKLNIKQNFGLIWFDAHMDAHTYKTSPSKAVHGMPVAILMGHGEPTLVDVVEAGAKINPKHLVLVGVRSFEPEEAQLLKKLGVKVFYMEDIRQRGFEAVAQEALEIVSKTTAGFGISVDLDGFDPEYAPGVGSPVEGGLTPMEVLPVFKSLFKHRKFKGLEITEFNPTLDIDDKTAQLTQDILKQLID